MENRLCRRALPNCKAATFHSGLRFVGVEDYKPFARLAVPGCHVSGAGNCGVEAEARSSMTRDMP